MGGALLSAWGVGMYSGVKGVLSNRKNADVLKTQLSARLNAGEMTPLEAQYEYLNASDNPTYKKLASQLYPSVQKVRSEPILASASAQTAGMTDILNQNLESNIRRLNTQRAMAGTLRSGGRINDITNMQIANTRAIASVGAENALQAQGMIQQGKQFQQNYDLQIAQLEAAKNAQDTQAIGSIAEQMAGSIFEQLQNKHFNTDITNLGGQPYNAGAWSSFFSEEKLPQTWQEQTTGQAKWLQGIFPRTQQEQNYSSSIDYLLNQ